MPNRIDSGAGVDNRTKRNFSRLAATLQLEQIGPPDSAPADTVTVVVWLKVIVDGVEYRLPLYQ